MEALAILVDIHKMNVLSYLFVRDATERIIRVLALEIKDKLRKLMIGTELVHGILCGMSDSILRYKLEITYQEPSIQ